MGGCNGIATPNPHKSDDKIVEEMFTKCSTAQSFIRTEMTTYRIGTLGLQVDVIMVSFLKIKLWVETIFSISKSSIHWAF